MARKWNTLAPVIAVIPGESAAGAIAALAAQLPAAGFDVHEGEPGGYSAFESDDSEDDDPAGAVSGPLQPAAEGCR